MSYIGNTSTTQAFTPAVDYFSGNGSTTAFTLSRPVASVAQVQVVIDNVAQNPSSAYTVSSNTITFTSAPLSGTNNIYVYYTSPITQVIAPGQGTVTTTSFASSTGSGAVVLATSPTLVTPALGTPSALVLTNATGLPQTGLGTNVAGNGPAFRAYAASVTTTVTGNTDTKVSLDTETFDTNNNFASSRFTPTVAGYYQINGCVQINYWNGIIFSASIFKNGSVHAYGETSYPQTTGGVRATVSDIVYCNGSTDYVELYAYQYNASSSNVTATGTQSTYFSGCLIRGA
jgi:hypothetical protein